MCMASHRARRRALIVEPLEKREMMAGDVATFIQGQMLIVWGDAADNGVTLTYNSANQSYRVSGHDAGGSPTTINGLADAEFTGIQQVYFGLNGGNDDLEVGSPAAVDTVIQKWLSIEMGDGDDSLILGAAGNSPGGAAPVARSLDIGTSLNVDLGAGHDHLSLGNAKIGYALNVLAGDGNDIVVFDTAFTPAGASDATLFPVFVRSNVLVSLGGGTDELTMTNAAIQGGLAILDGAGAADLVLYNVGVKNKISIHTAGDADNVDLERISAKQLNINTNGGIDNVRLNKVALSTLNVKLGGGRDRLRINRTRTTVGTHLDGEFQSATLSGANNSLRGLWRRNFG